MDARCIDLTDSIERLMKTEPVALKEVIRNEIISIGLSNCFLQPFLADEQKERNIYGSIDHRTWLHVEFYDSPLVLADDYVHLCDGAYSGLFRVELACANSFFLDANMQLKPAKEIINNFKEFILEYSAELDLDNIDYKISNCISHNRNRTVWSTDKVIPIYRGNKDYELVSKKALKR